MAMLAEPRRKKRYNLVPKGKPLFEDGDRFGTKMLEKMGWSKGKGLGSREDGQQDFIRIRYKNDADGLGFIERDNQWTEHEKHFNGLLDSLNGENSTSNNASDECEVATPAVGFGFKSKGGGKEKLTDKFSGQSLEEKSKNSKARVHYKKFTKGKDMSQYSEKDLANIFGKKASPDDDNIYSQFQAFNAGDDKDEIIPLESGTNIINTGVSVSDYFKLKMDAKKGVPVPSENGVDNVDAEAPVKQKKRKKQSTGENPESSKNPATELGTQIINTGVSVNDYFKSKMEALKQKKSVHLQNGTDKNVEAEEVKPEVEAIESDLSPTEEAPIKKKKKKSKKQPMTELEEEGPVVDKEEVECSSKKKKKSKNLIVIQDKFESSTVEGISVEPCQNEISSKKKKNKKRLAEEVAAIDDTESSKNIPKKMKMEMPEEPQTDTTEIPKKKKKKQSDSVQITELEHEVETSPVEERSSSKKKTNSIKNLHKQQSEILPLDADEIASKKKKNKNLSVEENKSDSLTTSSTETTKLSKEKKNKQANSAEPPSKMKTIKTNPNATTPTEVSSQHTLIPLKDNCLLDTYTISTFCAEKFRNIDLHQFRASSILQINGYGLGENLELKIETNKNDQERIIQLWSSTLNKYHYATPKHKVYSNYMEKVKQLRRTQNKIPSMRVKCLKRKAVFQCL